MGKVKGNNNNDKNAMWTGCVIRVFEVVKFVSIFHSLFLYKWKWKLLYLCAPLMMSQSNSQCFVTSHGRLYDYRESNNAFWRLFLGKSELMPDLSEQRAAEHLLSHEHVMRVLMVGEKILKCPGVDTRWREELLNKVKCSTTPEHFVWGQGS